MHKSKYGLSMLHDPCLIPEPCKCCQDCYTSPSVYSVAADGEAIYLQQVFLGWSVCESASFQSRVSVDDFVIVLLVRSRQECV